MSKKPLSAIDVLLRYWQIIVFLGLGLIAYGKLQSDQAQLNMRVSNTETSILTANAGIAAANVNNANVAGDIKAINGKLDLLINHSGLVYGK